MTTQTKTHTKTNTKTKTFKKRVFLYIIYKGTPPEKKSFLSGNLYIFSAVIKEYIKCIF